MELKNATSWNLKRVQSYQVWDLKKDYSRFNLPRIFHNRASIVDTASCRVQYYQSPEPSEIPKLYALLPLRHEDVSNPTYERQLLGWQTPICHTWNSTNPADRWTNLPRIFETSAAINKNRRRAASPNPIKSPETKPAFPISQNPRNLRSFKYLRQSAWNEIPETNPAPYPWNTTSAKPPTIPLVFIYELIE